MIKGKYYKANLIEYNGEYTVKLDVVTFLGITDVKNVYNVIDDAGDELQIDVKQWYPTAERAIETEFNRIYNDVLVKQKQLNALKHYLEATYKNDEAILK